MNKNACITCYDTTLVDADTNRESWIFFPRHLFACIFSLPQHLTWHNVMVLWFQTVVRKDNQLKRRLFYCCPCETSGLVTALDLDHWIRGNPLQRHYTYSTHTVTCPENATLCWGAALPYAFSQSRGDLSSSSNVNIAARYGELSNTLADNLFRRTLTQSESVIMGISKMPHVSGLLLNVEKFLHCDIVTVSF